MILVDTSVWTDHLRVGDDELAAALIEDRVLVHPWVLGELALGGVPPDGPVGQLLSNLPGAPVATQAEVLELIARRRLAGRGVGYVDAHLIASALLRLGTSVWTRDRRLAAVADELGVGV